MLGLGEDNRRTWVQLDVPESEGMRLARAGGRMHAAPEEPTLKVPGPVRRGSLPMALRTAPGHLLLNQVSEEALRSSKKSRTESKASALVQLGCLPL